MTHHRRKRSKVVQRRLRSLSYIRRENRDIRQITPQAARQQHPDQDIEASEAGKIFIHEIDDYYEDYLQRIEEETWYEYEAAQDYCYCHLPCRCEELSKEQIGTEPLKVSFLELFHKLEYSIKKL